MTHPAIRRTIPLWTTFEELIRPAKIDELTISQVLHNVRLKVTRLLVDGVALPLWNCPPEREDQDLPADFSGQVHLLFHRLGEWSKNPDYQERINALLMPMRRHVYVCPFYM